MMQQLADAYARARGWWRSWWRSWWHRPASEALYVTATHTAPAPEPVPAPMPETHARAASSLATLADLLDNVEQAMDSITAPLAHAQVERELRTALRRLGPHVIGEHPVDLLGDDFMQSTAAVHVSSAHRPTLMCIHYGGPQGPLQRLSKRETARGAVFFYAQKINRLPALVQRWGAVHYVAGIGFRGLVDRKVFWSGYYVGIDARTGEVRTLKHRYPQRVEIAPARQAYTRQHYGVSLLEGQLGPQRWGSEAQAMQMLARYFAHGFDAWNERERYWALSLHKGAQRATICIEQQNTPRFFKDRQRTALTPGGRLRPIIHYVHAHERLLGEGRATHVREHLRGLRIFDWRGYHCAVTSPKFHVLATVEFSMPPADEDAPQPEGAIDAPELARRLVRFEVRPEQERAA